MYNFNMFLIYTLNIYMIFVHNICTLYDILRMYIYIYVYGPVFAGPHSPRDWDGPL